MRKKWTYVAIVSMMLGVAPVFTGCVDTDEPAGIENLRGAKAELLRAKAAVEQANAQWVLADAQYREALARHENALAAQAEYEAEKRKLEAEMKAAQNERDKIQLQKEIADLQAQMEENALYHQTTMLQLQMNFEKVRLEYENLMKAIEIAEATGNGVPTTIADLKRDVQEKYAKLYGGDYIDALGNPVSVSAENSLYYKLQAAQKKVYDISLNHAHGIVNDEGKDKYIPRLELQVANQQAIVDAEKEALQKLQDFLKNDTETTDWRAEIEELETALEDIKKAVDAKNVELEKAKNSESYLALAHALYGVYGNTATGGTTDVTGVEGTMADEYLVDWEAAAQDGAWQVYKRAEKDLNTLKLETEFTLEGDKMETKVSKPLNDLLQAMEREMYGLSSTATVTDWQNGLVYDEIVYRYYYNDGTKDVYPSFDVEKDEYPATINTGLPVSQLFAHFQNWKEVLAAASENNYKNAIEMAKLEKARLNDEIEKKDKPNYDKKVAEWRIALDAYSKGTIADFTKDEDYGAVTEIFTGYSTAYKALADAVKAYNDTYSSKYTEAYNTYISEERRLTYYEYGLDAFLANVPAGFNIKEAESNIENITGARTIDAYEDAIRKACSAAGENDKAAVEAAVWTAIETYVQTLLNNNKELIGKAEAAAKKAAGDAVDINKVNVAQGTLSKAANKITSAFTTLDNIIMYPYAQKRTTDAAKASTLDVLIGKYNEETKKYELKLSGTTVTAYQKELDEKGNETGKLEVIVTDLEAAEITAATKTELLPKTNIKGVVVSASEAAFGVLPDEYWAADELPTPDEILAAYEEYIDAGYSYPEKPAGIIYAQKVKEVEEKDEAINQVADLGKLKAEVDAAYDALVKEFQTKYDEAFAGAEKALDDATEKLLAADAALFEAEEAFATIKAEIAELEAKYNAQTAIRNTLIQAVTNNLGIEWPNGSGTGTGQYNPETFEDALEAAIAYQKSVVVNVEEALAKLKIALTKAQDGQYDDMADAQLALDIATYNFNTAWEAYQDALENLQKGLAVAADEAEEEQPAE